MFGVGAYRAGGRPELPDETSILIAAPIINEGHGQPEHAPSGWPFGLRWVQLGSSGIDFYPRWFFRGTARYTARGTSSTAIAEFRVWRRSLRHAKRLPDIWIHDAQQWALTPLRNGTRQARLAYSASGSIGQALARKALALGAPGHCGAASDFYRRRTCPRCHLVPIRAELVREPTISYSAARLLQATRHIVSRELLAHASPDYT